MRQVFWVRKILVFVLVLKGLSVFAFVHDIPEQSGSVQSEFISVDNNIPSDINPENSTQDVLPPCSNPPTLDSMPDISFCEGGSANLYAILGGSATTVTWSGGLGVYNFPNAPDQTILEYIPDPSEIGTTVTLTATTDDPDGPGPCLAASTQVHLSIITLPTATISCSPVPVCTGTTTFLDIVFTGMPPFVYAYADGFTIQGPFTTSNYSISIPVVPTAATNYEITSITDLNCDGAPVSFCILDIKPCGPPLQLDLHVYIEGLLRGPNLLARTLYDLYNAGIGSNSDSTASDTITVNLWAPFHLANPIPDFSTRAVLHTNGMAAILFLGADTGSYYIAVKHRNSIETWSMSPVSFSGVLTSYDFTLGNFTAFDDGNNPAMKNVGGQFAIYSGDVDQNGGIDIFDLAICDNDATVFSFGYNASDCDGDMGTDILDLSIVDNNAQLFLFYARP